jgi:uncharacterized membrane protein
MNLATVLHNPIVHGAITGAAAAAAVDLHAFATWKNMSDLKSYSWGVAAFRWFQGAVIGAITAAGMGGLGA